VTHYAVGDIQGCFEALIKLLAKIQFDPDQDCLISVGDLVNRGPQSLETLRYCKNLGDSFATVLGNHDLHLLAIAHGIRNPTSKDTLNPILEASDKDELLDWLQQQPLLLNVKGYTIVHAGIPPQWSIAKAEKLANEVNCALTSENSGAYFSAMYGNYPLLWSDDLYEPARLRVITNYLTRMRFCTADGELDLDTKSTIIPPTGHKAWFSHSGRKTEGNKIIFGHWAALEGRDCGDNLFPLDTGYVWGGPMRIMNRDTEEYIHINP
jgi:bis(5'-nucleosyl)-tetraphosphatase (symmetrical)